MSKLGVPTPYKVHLHPWPTRFHGPIYTRPVFGFPQIAKTQDVIIPSQEQTAGLGSVGWDTREGVFGPSVRGGGIFSGSISGLGATDDAAKYPWRQKSDDTLALQKATNVALRAAGYCPIEEDGYLGPGTCGARNRLTIESDSAIFKNPSTCQSYTTPRKVSEGCRGPGPAAAPALPPGPAPLQAGMSASSSRALAFAVGGVAALGLLYYLRKKKR